MLRGCVLHLFQNQIDFKCNYAKHIGRCLSYVETQEGFQSKPVKPFSQVPGPKSLPVLKQLHHFLPIGKYYNVDRLKILKTISKEYGHVAKLSMPFMSPQVIITGPSDIKQILQAEKNNPIRCIFQAAAFSKETKGEPIGLIASEGEEWVEYRNIAQKALGGPVEAFKYIDKHLISAKKLVNHLSPHEKCVFKAQSFMDVAKLWSLDTMLYMVTGKDPKCFHRSEETQKIIKMAALLFDKTIKLESSIPLWKYYKTKDFLGLEKALEILWTNFYWLVEGSLREPLPNTLSYSLRSDINNKVTHRKALAVLIDLMILSIDTTSTTLTYLMQNIARYPNVQNKILEEIRTILPNEDDILTQEKLAGFSYVKACLKESFRTYPVAAGYSRVLTSDMVLSGYHVPKGIRCLIFNSFIFEDSNNFQDVESFKPERWLRNSECNEIKRSQWYFFPFGHGIRNCVGRRFAEQAVWIAAIELVRNYKVDTKHDSLQQKIRLINVPTTDVSLTFTKR